MPNKVQTLEDRCSDTLIKHISMLPPVIRDKIAGMTRDDIERKVKEQNTREVSEYMMYLIPEIVSDIKKSVTTSCYVRTDFYDKYRHIPACVIQGSIDAAEQIVSDFPDESYMFRRRR